MRVFAVRIRRARARHFDTGFFHQFNNALCAAVGSVKGDKITALGFVPCAETFKFRVQFFQNSVEMGFDDCGVLCHQVENSLRVLEKSDVTHLIEFIRSDELI